MPFPNPATQFKPGNPGRPKGRSVTDRLRAFLDKGEINGKPIAGGKQVVDLLVEVIVRNALTGNHKFCELILERIEGKAGGESPGGGAAEEVESLREFLASVPASKPARRERQARGVLGGPAGPDVGVPGSHDPA